MRYEVVIALLLSVLMHVILIASLTFSVNIKPSNLGIYHNLAESNLNVHTLQVGFSILDKSESLRLERVLNTAEISKKYPNVNPLSEYESLTKVESQGVGIALPISESMQNRSASDNVDRLSKYLKPNEVDIKAMPTHGITPPKLTGINQLLVIYKLRVFVNKNGRVDEVVNLDDTSLVQLLYTDIESQVKELLFIPAKKDGLAVDSYIDVALEF